MSEPIELLPCRFCKGRPFVIGEDDKEGEQGTDITCGGKDALRYPDSCKMGPSISAKFYNDAAKMWNAAMTVDARRCTICGGVVKFDGREGEFIAKERVRR